MSGLEYAIAGFVVLFALANPFAMAVFFVGMTPGWSKTDRNSVALRATVVSIGIAIGCIIAGQAVLNFFGVSIPALQVAGGLIFVQVGLGMLNGTDAKSEEPGEPIELSEATKRSTAITPLAIPFLVGPGLIAILVSVSATIEDTASLVGLIVGVLVGYVAVYAGLLMATFFSRLLGESGTEILTRLLGLIVLGVGISMMVTGIVELLPGLA